ncbi:MAG TPA: group III truncated hemoglobin [Acidobacteriaceae bacterium]|nr:group III truncated hemoglobin [Acidobacteriaceae bacterium]
MNDEFEGPISESEISRLVEAFYSKVRVDPTIGPIFNEKVEDWPAHLALLKSFWCSALLGAGTFKGNPLLTHLKLALEPAHFRVWLSLFAETASEVLPPSRAAVIIARSQGIARSFQSASWDNRNLLGQ